MYGINSNFRLGIRVKEEVITMNARKTIKSEFGQGWEDGMLSAIPASCLFVGQVLLVTVNHSWEHSLSFRVGIAAIIAIIAITYGSFPYTSRAWCGAVVGWIATLTAFSLMFSIACYELLGHPPVLREFLNEALWALLMSLLCGGAGGLGFGLGQLLHLLKTGLKRLCQSRY